MTNTYHEYVGNLHMHTTYSDGAGSHADILEAALQAELDFVVVTDHNILVRELDAYYGPSPDRRVLLLVGEEVHDMRRDPQVNHLLVYNAGRELSAFAASPQNLINQVNDTEEGFCFIAHPVDEPAPAFHEIGLPWVDWDVDGFAGLEIWNYMTEFKSHLSSRWQGIRAAFNPDTFISGPFPESLNLWDKLLNAGKEVFIIGNADAHGLRYSLGPISRVIFPYEYLFRCVNTHVLTLRPLTDDPEQDRRLLLESVRTGRSFVGYDLPASTKGFRFSASGHNFTTTMGGMIKLGHGVTLQIVSPQIAEIRLLRNGEIVEQETAGTHKTFIAREPGVYRVEVYIHYKGKPRGWIFSNPIFIKK